MTGILVVDAPLLSRGGADDVGDAEHHGEWDALTRAGGSDPKRLEVLDIGIDRLGESFCHDVVGGDGQRGGDAHFMKCAA